MQVDLLCRMVADLILDRDEVGLPGLGAFYAEVVPASFSDKGFTINPPYRRLTFRAGQSDDNSLVECYSTANNVDAAEAEARITAFISELAAELKEHKSVDLPGLGKLRATKDNILFFVGDPDLNIFPDGFGLEPISLRAHDGIKPVARPVEPEEETAVEPEEETAVEPEEETAVAPEEETAVELPKKAKHRKPRFWLILLWVIILAAVALALFAAIARLYPDIVDTILYTPEQLRILNS